MSLILMTPLFYKAVILNGEIWRWSLLGLKGLKVWVEKHIQKGNLSWTFTWNCLFVLKTVTQQLSETSNQFSSYVRSLAT